MFRPEDYVTHDVGLILKEIGFNEPVHSQYTKTGTAWVCQEPENFNESVDCCCSRPTLYEAQRWLRENYDIHLDIKIICFHAPTRKSDFICDIHSLNSKEYRETKVYRSYEKVLNEGIRESCELIKNRRIWNQHD